MAGAPERAAAGGYDRFLSPAGRELHESAIRRMGTVIAAADDIISFAAGYPDPAGFPWGELRALANGLLSGADPGVLQYGPTRGYGPLIASIGDLLEDRGIGAGRDDVLVTSGSQQGLDLVARVLVTPGDVVLVELPAYTGAISAFRNAGARLAGVRQEADGIDLADLDAVLARERNAGGRAHLLYLVPNYQNPTGVLLSDEKRRELVLWARRRDVLILEDDPYGAISFDRSADPRHTRPIRALDGEHVIYTSTVSKTLAPGFRVGWIVAPPPLVERFDTAKQSMDLTTGVLDQRIVHEALRQGVMDRIAPRLRDLYREKRDLMEAALRVSFGGAVEWLQPRGGFFLWLTLPPQVDDDALLARALEERLVFVAGSAFYVDGTGHDRVRLSFSTPAPDGIAEGVRRLASAVAALDPDARRRGSEGARRAGSHTLR